MGLFVGGVTVRLESVSPSIKYEHIVVVLMIRILSLSQISFIHTITSLPRYIARLFTQLLYPTTGLYIILRLPSCVVFVCF